MNEPHEFLDLDSRIDRLVDGELRGDEYRELLLLLEEKEDGWRRCAMAFLEAQAWSQELDTVRQQAESPMPIARSATATGRSAIFLVAIAASFLLAFGLWSHFERWLAGGDPPGGVVQQPSVGTSGSPTALAEEALGMESLSDGAPMISSDLTNGRPLGLATFVMDGDDGSSKEIDVPVFPVNDAYGKAVLEDSTNVPPYIRRALQKLGYEVRRDLHWAPVELKEGGQMMVPYGQVEITPVSNRSFQ